MVPKIYHRVVKPTSKPFISSMDHNRRKNEMPRLTVLPEPWKMHRCSVVDPKTREVLDEGLAVYFAGTFVFNWELELSSLTSIPFGIISSKVIHWRRCSGAAYPFGKSNHHRHSVGSVETPSMSNGGTRGIH
jgi:hypothetical protein